MTVAGAVSPIMTGTSSLVLGLFIIHNYARNGGAISTAIRKCCHALDAVGMEVEAGVAQSNTAVSTS